MVLFTDNTYVVGLAGNNYYYASNVSEITIDTNSNSLKFTGVGGYGIALVKNLRKNKTYNVYCNYSGDAGFNIVVVYYSADGTMLGNRYYGVGVRSITTVDYDFAYSLIVFAAPNTSSTGTFSNISLHEVN